MCSHHPSPSWVALKVKHQFSVRRTKIFCHIITFQACIYLPPLMCVSWDSQICATLITIVKIVCRSTHKKEKNQMPSLKVVFDVKWDIYCCCVYIYMSSSILFLSLQVSLSSVPTRMYCCRSYDWELSGCFPQDFWNLWGFTSYYGELLQSFGLVVFPTSTTNYLIQYLF